MDTPQRHLLVDGHNVLHAWGWMSAGEPVARARLIEALRVLHDLEPVDVSVIFDSRGGAAKADPAATSEGFLVKYASAGLTADGEIERLVAGVTTTRRSVVVTGDAMIRGNVMAAGGDCLSPEELRAWIERCQARARRALGIRKAAHGESFGNKLPL